MSEMLLKVRSRLPRKVKKRYKKMYAERLGMPPHKLKMRFPRRDYKINFELETEEENEKD